MKSLKRTALTPTGSSAVAAAVPPRSVCCPLMGQTPDDRNVAGGPEPIRDRPASRDEPRAPLFHRAVPLLMMMSCLALAAA